MSVERFIEDLAIKVGLAQPHYKKKEDAVIGAAVNFLQKGVGNSDACIMILPPEDESEKKEDAS